MIRAFAFLALLAFVPLTAEKADQVEKSALFFNTHSTIPGSRDVGYGHVCIDNYWYSLFYDAKGK